MLAASEDASVWSVWRWNEFHQCRRSNWVRSLNSADGHGIRDGVERKVHVLLEEASELGSNKEWLGRAVLNDIFPDDLLLAVGRHGLILWGVKVVLDLQLWATVLINRSRLLITLLGRLVTLLRRLVTLLRSILLLMTVALRVELWSIVCITIMALIALIMVLSLRSGQQERGTKCESHVVSFKLFCNYTNSFLLKP